MCGTEPYSGSGSCFGSSSTPEVTIDGNVAGLVAGKYISDALSTDYPNKATVTMTAGTVNDHVYGGHAHKAFGWPTANENKVTISGGTVEHSVFGGNITEAGDAHRNKVTIEGSSTTVEVDVAGGRVLQQGNLEENEVTISGATVQRDVTGADCRQTGTLKNNTVTINGGATVKGEVSGAFTNMGTAEKNTVNISGNSTIIHGDVKGCWNYSGISCTGSSVNISGGTVKGDVYGSFITLNKGATTDNTITLAGGTVEGTVYGGKGWGDEVSGNTLNVQGKNLEVGGVANFEKFAFTLPSGFNAASDVALNITGTEDVNLDGVTITVGGNIPTLAAGESLTLISKTTGTPASVTVPGYEVDTGSSGKLVIKPKIYIITATATPDGAGTVNCDPNPVPEGAIVTCSVTFSGDYNKVGDLTNLQASLPAGVTCTPASETAVTCTGMTNDLSVEIPLIKENTDPGTGGGGGTDPGTGGGSTGGDTPGGDTPGGNTPGAGGGGDSSSPTMGELGLLLSGIALAGAAAPALRRRERKTRKQD